MITRIVNITAALLLMVFSVGVGVGGWDVDNRLLFLMVLMAWAEISTSLEMRRTISLTNKVVLPKLDDALLNRLIEFLQNTKDGKSDSLTVVESQEDL